jgi:serine O-acetyltransferase
MRCLIEGRVLAIVLMRLSQKLSQKKILWRIAPYVQRINEILTGFECHLNAIVGEGLFIAHTQNIVVGEGVCIGVNVTLYNGVTLGACVRSQGPSLKRYPTIEDNAIIYTGAKVLGPITIGSSAVVGANAVVLQNVPSEMVAVGVPARILPGKFFSHDGSVDHADNIAK